VLSVDLRILVALLVSSNTSYDSLFEGVNINEQLHNIILILHNIILNISLFIVIGVIFFTNLVHLMDLYIDVKKTQKT
jgi:hypothetical protein